MENRIKCAVLGSGNIGTDLLYKAMRSTRLEPAWMVGVDPRSDGLARAAQLGLRTTDAGLEGFLDFVEREDIRIAFDATSAYAHARNAAELGRRGVIMVDLTPAAIGAYCVPTVNLAQLIDKRCMNVNLVSCGGQATIPIVAAIRNVQAVAYGEIISTIASRSAGAGTRRNIDEFTRTTADGIEKIGGARQGKAIIILNPATPPITMRATVHCLTENAPNRALIMESIEAMVAEVQSYVPGYTLKNEPIFDGKRTSVFLEVNGLGDYLPTYAGNLDIMTSAAIRTGEMLASEIVRGSFGPGTTPAHFRTDLP